MKRVTIAVGIVTLGVILALAAYQLRPKPPASELSPAETVELDRLKSELLARRVLGVELDTRQPDKGVRVLVMGGAAARAGIINGDVLLKVGETAVDAFSLWKVLEGASGRIHIETASAVYPVLLLPPGRISDDLERLRSDGAAQLRLGAIMDTLWFNDLERRRNGLQPPLGVRLLPVPRGPALRAGIQPKDILLRIDGKDVSERDLADQLESRRTGERVTLSILREGARLEVPVVLDAFQSFDEKVAGIRAGILGRRWLGALIDENLAIQPKAGSAAERAGLRSGDVLVSVAGRDVTLLSFPDAIPSGSAEVVVRRGTERVSVTVPPGEFTVADDRRAELATLAELYLGVLFEPDQTTLKVVELASRIKSGLEVGDVLSKPATREALADLLAASGREVTVYRGGKEVALTLTHPEIKTYAEKAVEAAGVGAAEVYLGAALDALKVVRSRIPQLRAGDVLLRIDGVDVTAASIGELLARRKPEGDAEVEVLREGGRVVVRIALGDRAGAVAELAAMRARAIAALDFGLAWPGDSKEPMVFAYRGGAAYRAGVRSGDEVRGAAPFVELFGTRAPVTLKTRRGVHRLTPGDLATLDDELEEARRDGVARLVLGVALEGNLRVLDIATGGPGDGRLTAGDEIVGLDGAPIDAAGFVRAVLRLGRTTEIEVQRGGERLKVIVLPEGAAAARQFDEFCSKRKP
jgi:S1-C subfamily serine protease